MHQPNANIFGPIHWGLDKDSLPYVDRNWKSYLTPNMKLFFSNPLKQLMVFIKIALSGSHLDLWNMVVQPRMYVSREDCPVCKTLQRKQKKEHLIAHCPICHSSCHTNGSVENRKIKDKLEPSMKKLTNLCLDKYGNLLAPYILTEYEMEQKKQLRLISEIEKGLQIFPKK